MKTKISMIALLAFAVASPLAAASPDLGAIETRSEHAALAVDLDSAASAASELDSALVAEPTPPALLYLRGLACYAAASCARARQDNDSALANFDKATAVLEWRHADALVWIGIAKQKSGHLDEARKAWTDALALEPDYAWVKYSLLPSVSNSP